MEDVDEAKVDDQIKEEDTQEVSLLVEKKLNVSTVKGKATSKRIVGIGNGILTKEKRSKRNNRTCSKKLQPQLQMEM